MRNADRLRGRVNSLREKVRAAVSLDPSMFEDDEDEAEGRPGYIKGKELITMKGFGSALVKGFYIQREQKS